MKMTTAYIITTETRVIFPYFNECGKLLSMILEGDEVKKVDCSPMEIIDMNLRRVGSSLNGAIDSAKEILGSGSMPPVCINKSLGIYMTPTASPRVANCIWMSVGHVNTYSKYEKGKVVVKLRGGSTVELPISEDQMSRRVQRACTLQYSIETNTREANKVKEPYTQTYTFKQPKNSLNFEKE